MVGGRLFIFAPCPLGFLVSDEGRIGSDEHQGLKGDTCEPEKLKKDLSLKSMDALMVYMQSLPRHPVPEVAEEDDPGNEWEAPEQEAKKKRSPAALLHERARRKARHVGVLHGI